MTQRRGSHPPRGMPVRAPTEASEQEALFALFAQLTPRIPELAWAFHVPNGGARHIVVAMQLQAQGVKPGVPDIWLPIARSPFAGLVIEMKRATGRIAPAQEVWLDFLETQYWCCVVAWSMEQAARETLRYLGYDVAELAADDSATRVAESPARPRR